MYYSEEDKNSLFLFICVVAKFPKDIVSIVPVTVITSILLKLHRVSTMPDYFRIGSRRRKIFENDRKETASKAFSLIRHRNNTENCTWKTLRYFINFESQIHIEISTSNRCCNFHGESSLKIDEISTNMPRWILKSNRWRCVRWETSQADNSRILRIKNPKL